MSELVERLRNPLWAHSNIPFESPQLEKDENVADMAAAADAIERLHVAVRAVLHQNDKHGSSLPVPIIEMLREALVPAPPSPIGGEQP